MKKKKIRNNKCGSDSFMSRPNEDERGHIFNTGIITKLRDICNQYNIYLFLKRLYKLYVEYV